MKPSYLYLTAGLILQKHRSNCHPLLSFICFGFCFFVVLRQGITYVAGRNFLPSYLSLSNAVITDKPPRSILKEVPGSPTPT